MVKEGEDFSINSKDLEEKMVSHPAPLPQCTDFSVPRLETNSSDPNPNHMPAQPTPTFLAACDVVARLHAPEHLATLEISAADLLEEHKENEIVTDSIDYAPASSARPKWNRQSLLGTLHWLRMVARNPGEPGILKPNFGGHVFRVLQLRKHMCADVDFSLLTNRKALMGMLDWVRHVAISPHKLGITGKDYGKYFATAVQIRAQMFAADKQHGLASVEITECDVRDYKNAALLSTRGIVAPRVGPCYQADVPEWTGKPSLPDEDPNALRFVREHIWTPESDVYLNGGSTGKRKRDEYEFPGSLSYVRTLVADRRYVLKRELGPAFSKMGFDRMGESVALTWTVDEEMTFYTTIEQNRFSSKLWDRLLAALVHSKSREDIVSYYYNVYLVRTKSYQNWLVPGSAGSDYDPMA